MKFGVQMFPADYAIPVTELAQAVEAAGFESLWFPEHTHIPTSRKSPWPGGPELPREYSHTLDQFVALGAAAAVTKTLLLGSGICLVVERDPIQLAKEVASVDHLSGGRLLFGIGGGWNLEEMENHGTDPKTRWKLMRERIMAMKEIWTKDEAEYHGKYVNFDPIWSWPKPVQKPHPPIIVGGSGAHTLDRVLEYGDGWMPIGGRMTEDLGAKIGELNARAKAMGRGPIPVSIFGAAANPATFDELAKAGVDRAVLGLPPAPAETVLPLIERYAETVRAWGG
jgi:probable F420-dependent oxidoreductase